jgi:D-alanyl-D-alanine carboxypeptidase (penicillin-binding protein 5/6)
MTTKKKLFIAFAGACGAVFFMALGLILGSMGTGTQGTKPAPKPTPLPTAESALLDTLLRVQYPQRPVAPLPYPALPPDFPVAAESALVIDATTGSIVYEKNADIPVPPASLTKIAVMYVVLQELAAGRYHLDDIVPLPAESWAVNAPEGSSLMF